MTSDLDLANQSLTKGSYQSYYNHIKRYHIKENSTHSTDLLDKASKMLATFTSLQDFLKIPPTDYYKILDIEPNSSVKDIENSYKRLIFKYHPNLTKVKECNEAVQRIQTAYTVLTDPVKKRQFDMKRHSHSSNSDYVDFYEVLRRRMENESDVNFVDFRNEFLFREIYNTRMGDYFQRGRRRDRETRDGKGNLLFLFIVIVLLMFVL